MYSGRTEEADVKTDEFREYLAEYPYTDEQIAACLDGVRSLEAYLSGLAHPINLGEATADQVAPFTATMVAQRRNDRQRFVGIYIYAGMIENYDLQVAVLELLDGFEILGNLHRVIGAELGEAAQAEIFADVTLPEIGTTPLDWTRINSVILPRLEARANASTVRRILRSGLRNLPDEIYFPIKERYEALDDLDAFLEDRGRRHLHTLQEHRDQGTPYFNQYIDGGVIDFVAANPEIGRGVRCGNTIIETKIPHQAIEYLAADDLATKQYRVCHCPLVKESMARDDISVSPTFCEFCPSFNAKPWEVIFEQKLDYEVLESAKLGGKWCRFAIHLPEGAI
jgi:hypothetical protein